MATQQPGFITGANAKIKVHGETLAYCTDVSYNITVQTIPVESMGKYEVHSNEPVAYMIDGTFSVIRYTKRATESKIPNVVGTGNQSAQIGGDTNGTLVDHIDPAKILASKTFDLEIFERGPGATDTEDTTVFKAQDCRLTRKGMSLNKRGIMVESYAFVGVVAGDTDQEYKVGLSGFQDLGT